MQQTAGRYARMRARAARAGLVAAVAVLSGGAALAAWGSTSHPVGPLETRLSLVPSLQGGVRVDVPPLGRLRLPTHAGPLQVSATVTGVDPARARALLRSRSPGRTVTAQVASDSLDALAVAVAKALVVSLLGSALMCAVVFRRPRAVLGGTAAVTAVLLASAGAAGATLRTEAFNEPTFDGLLEQAPVLIGRVESFDAYSDRVAQLIANVARVYAGLSRLPVSVAPNSTRLLWVSDIHNNPAAYDVMAQLVEQFDATAIVDTGDIVDVGSTVENRGLSRLGGFGVPYLYVRGNHDSAATQAAVARQRGAVVLDGGKAVEVAGIRFAGMGDPLFRPNRTVESQSDANDALLRAAGERLLAAVDADPAPVDVVVAHNAKTVEPLVGKVPLILNGHTHERRSRVQDGTLQLTQGSSGGAGLRTLDEGAALPLQMSVLSFDDTGGLLAVDDVTIGGLGQRSVTVERRTPDSYGDLTRVAG